MADLFEQFTQMCAKQKVLVLDNDTLLYTQQHENPTDKQKIVMSLETSWPLIVKY